jgi:hypothetical protein
MSQLSPVLVMEHSQKVGAWICHGYLVPATEACQYLAIAPGDGVTSKGKECAIVWAFFQDTRSADTSAKDTQARPSDEPQCKQLKHRGPQAQGLLQNPCNIYPAEPDKHELSPEKSTRTY